MAARAVIIIRGQAMDIFMLALCFVKSLPEDFNLKKSADEMPLTNSAPQGAEVSSGFWAL